ncbi:MAG: YhfC family glutamic-type intramembrane protease [Eubacteriales bacterium]|nr:YhfC family glutamic-type intramembrane protease [Eubacteriales bacterium]
MISSSILNLMMELITLSFVIPIVFIAVWKMRTRASLVPVFVGAGIYLLFAELFQSVPDTLFIGMPHPLADVINHNVWLLALYTAVTAALLQGLGRYLAFRYFLSKQESPDIAVSFGLGFGCVGCIMALGIANFRNYSFAQLINQKQTDGLLKSVDAATAKSYQSLMKELTDMDRMDLLLTGIQQFAFLFLQVALAVLVFYAVHKAGQIRFLWISIGLHALVIFLDAFWKANVVPQFVVVLCVIILTAGVAQTAYRLYKSIPVQEKTKDDNQDGWNYAQKRYVSKEETQSKDTDL